MKEIIDNIYAMFEGTKPMPVTDEWADNLGKEISSMLKERLLEKKDDYNLRMSSLGRGNRYLWYSVRDDIPKEQLRPEARIKFLFGDIIELMYIALIRLAGHEVTREQETVTLGGIVGHIDCAVDGKLVDIKSASSFSFKKFKEETLQQNDPFGYYAQLAAYAEATGLEPAGWFVMDKQLGHLCFSKAHESYLPDMSSRVEKVKEKVQQDIEPGYCAFPVPDGKSGNMKLHTMCSYCPYKKHCWRDANGGHGLRVFLYATGPKYLTNVAKIPKVPEVPIDTVD